MDTFYSVLAFVGGSTALLAAAAWLIRAVLKHGLSRDLEEFRSHLQSTAALQTEQLRHELRLVASDVEKRSSLLNEKRAQVIAELYRKLADFLSSAQSFAALAEWGGEPSKEDKAKVLGEKAADFFTYYQHHRIYFSEELCERLRSLFDTVHGPALKFRMWMNYKEKGGNAALRHDEAWNEAWDVLQRDVPPILNAIEREFRVLLGVTK
jgi:hypothetical protein